MKGPGGPAGLWCSGGPQLQIRNRKISKGQKLHNALQQRTEGGGHTEGHSVDLRGHGQEAGNMNLLTA